MASSTSLVEQNQERSAYLHMALEKGKPRVSINLFDLSLRLFHGEKQIYERPLSQMSQKREDGIFTKAEIRKCSSDPSSPSSYSDTLPGNKLIGESQNPPSPAVCSPPDGSTSHSPISILTERSPDKQLVVENRRRKERTSGTKTKIIPKPPSEPTKRNITKAKKGSNCNEMLRKDSSTYDADLEKSHQFLTGNKGSLTKAGQSLMPLKRGLKRVEVHYSETNVAQNNSKIFSDLIQNAHKCNSICQENAEKLERRLLNRRLDMTKATTFYDTDLVRPSSAPPRTLKNRTVAGKKEQRKKRINKKSKKIQFGHEPVVVPSEPTTEDFEEILNCRYLRIDPKYQKELYEIDNSGLFE